MYNRRNSLRSSSQRYSGISPAAAAAMVSFSQQNPRPNGPMLAANAAAEALRRHSLDAEGAKAAAAFRRNSITSQTSQTSHANARKQSLTRRDSLRTSSTVNRDQYGRAMSLTTTTVRQMGSFELVKQQETKVRKPRGPPPPESIYSLESLSEEPELRNPSRNRSRVSFLDDTSEFHYDTYGYSEGNALAAAAAVAPQRHLKPAAPVVPSKPKSPMKSALKKNNGPESSPISFEQHTQPIYEDEQEDEAREPEIVFRPLSAVSEFSTVTANSTFEESDTEGEVPEHESQAPSEPYAAASDDAEERLTSPSSAESFEEGHLDVPPTMANADVSTVNAMENGVAPSFLTNTEAAHDQPRSQLPTQNARANGVRPSQVQQAQRQHKRPPPPQQPAPREPMRQQAAAASRQANHLSRESSRANAYRQRLSQQPQAKAPAVPVQQSRNGSGRLSRQSSQARNNRASFVAAPSYDRAPRQLQPSPSIDGFSRIASTSDIIEQARSRARTYVAEKPQTVLDDDDDSINSESSFKRSGPRKSKFRTSNDLSPPHMRANSITSSQFGHRTARVSSPNGGRTYSLRGAPPPELGREWRSRFADSDDDEPVHHAPTALPQLVSVPTDGGKKKKKGFFRRLFSKN